MTTYKNPTPRQIAALSATFIALFSGIAILFLLLWPRTIWWVAGWLIVTGLIGVGAYLVIFYYLKRYIYRKIKLIYKTIHRQKVSPGQKSNQVNINADIIGEVEKEVEIWAALQREELDKYKSWAEYRRRFLGDISHELKTPIFNIQGYIHSLLEGGLEDEKVNVSFLQKAARNVDRLQTIVEDLEAISRLESGEMILDIQTFDIRELTLDVFEELEIKARKKGITLELKEGAQAGKRVKADRESIRQVLINLIHNSIKYGKSGGRTKVGFYDMDKYILLEVADNGIGIPSEHLPHVFDRFYRVDKSRSRDQGGSGLGLSIVKHIIEAHHQTINVRSSDNLGATFGFTLEKG